jgi:integrase
MSSLGLLVNRKKLTDTYIRTRRPAPSGQRDETQDTVHPRLRLRVTDTGHKSFIYLSRFPDSPHPTRRALGDYSVLTLEEARKKARSWDELIGKGIDPKQEEQRLQDEGERNRQATHENIFSARAKEYLEGPVARHRQSKETARIVRKELLPIWADRPLDSITSKDVKALVKAIADRGAPAMARNVLTVCKSFFDWAVELEHVGASPAAPVRPSKLIGEKKHRKRVLDDAELQAFWRATERMDYPYRELYRLLLLTGARLRELAGARWREVDLKKRLWIVPSERFKSDVSHLVPLSRDAVDIIRSLPKGDCLFSTTKGLLPVSGFSKAKAELDRLMAEELGTPLPHFVIHDLRRTLRTRLASLRVSDLVAEMIIGHGKRGLQRVYDQHTYEGEMREALELWARRLRDLVSAPPENVVALRV